MNLEGILRRVPDIIRPSRRFVRFLFVGVLNTAFGYGVFVASLWSGMHYALAAAVATTLGILFNFKSMGTLVFQSRSNNKLPRFIAVYSLVYVVNVLGLGLLLRLGIREWLGGLILILPCAMLSYILNSRFVYSP